MRILLALADSSQVDAASAWARRFQDGLRTPAAVTALHVVPLVAEGATGVMEEYAANDLDDVRARIAAAFGDLPGLAVEIQAGSPGKLICEAAAGHDLVVVGASHRSGLSELLMGSTSTHVLHHAPCNVLVLR